MQQLKMANKHIETACIFVFPERKKNSRRNVELQCIVSNIIDSKDKLLLKGPSKQDQGKTLPTGS